MSISSVTASPAAYRTQPPPIIYLNTTRQSGAPEQSSRPHHHRDGGSRASGVVSADASQATPAGSLLDTVV